MAVTTAFVRYGSTFCFAGNDNYNNDYVIDDDYDVGNVMWCDVCWWIVEEFYFLLKWNKFLIFLSKDYWLCMSYYFDIVVVWQQYNNSVVVAVDFYEIIAIFIDDLFFYAYFCSAIYNNKFKAF